MIAHGTTSCVLMTMRKYVTWGHDRDENNAVLSIIFYNISIQIETSIFNETSTFIGSSLPRKYWIYT